MNGLEMAGKKQMYLYWLSIALAVLANVFYHIIQKKTPLGANPALTLSMTYLAAAVICFVAFLVLPGREGLAVEFKRLNWTAAALGIAIIGLELGFLLAYRAGWNVSTAAMVANVAVAVLLVPVGLLLFKEELKPVNWIGVVLCIAGLLCMAKK
jgi:drug/metabolite transporter (DMT)-like permease